MDDQPPSRLKRPRRPMPESIRQALLERGLMEAYLSRYMKMAYHPRRPTS